MNAGKKKPRLQGKKPSHRNAIIKSLVVELLRAGKIKTTPAKAKILKSNIDKLINLAKADKESTRNEIEKFLSNARSAERLMTVAKAFTDKTSGYTRLVKTLPRKGDGAAQVYIMLTNAESAKSTKKSTIQKTLEKQKTKKK